MKRRFAFFALLFTLFCIAPAFAREIHFQTLGGVEGLSQSSAISIWQDNIGRMWLGNDAVNCYDGETVRVFRLSEYFPSIEDSNIHTITGNDSVMFVISESQLLCFDLHTEAFYMPDIQLTTIYCRGDDVFYASERTIYRYDWKKKNSHPLVTLPADVLGVRKIFSLPDGRLLLATPIGLFVVDASSGEIISHVLEDEDITALLVDSRNNILLSARSGKLYISSVNTSYPWSFSLLHHGDQCLAHTNVYCMAEDVSGSVWLGTLSGLYQLQRKNTNALEEDQLTVVNHVVPESTIYSLYSDRQGSLWIGSYYGDVRYFNPLINNYIYYKTDEEHPDRLHGAVIGDIVEDHSDNLYVTTEGSGMNILFAGQDKFRHLTTANGLHQNKLRCSWFDEEYNRLYLSEYMHGLSYYDLTAQKVYPLSNDTALSSPYARIIESIHPYKNFLILRTQRGLFKMHRHTLEISPLFKRNPELQELCSGIIRAVHVDERDILWVSSFTRGLFTIDIKSRKVLKYYGDGILPESVIPSAIVSMCEDSRKGLFLCTLKSGLLAYNPEDDSFTSFTEAAHELVSDICYKSVFSWYGNLIVTTNKGISILNLSSRKKLNSAYHIRLSSSYPLTALSGDCGLYASKRRDRIYVGGLYGLLIFSEKELG
ncbi:hybrid sensor histidine kinase/response regulator, partial [Parabacteroides sp. OttesenSCG-928-G06]|nr:hybrid sensor histidine kinase/response regulator [Parabacteroides sp. OttesenSCG-928-G06]